MAYSYTTYTGNGSTTQYAVAFGYIRREHVLATVAGSAATFTWVNSSLIQMDAAPANGAAVRVYRQTPLDAPLVNFTDGATLVATDLDTNANQSIYTQQELDDELIDGLAGVIPNGDKGDITTSVGGSVWTIDNGVITSAKIADGTIVNADVNASAAIAATKLAFTPAGNIAATTVQAALQELDDEKAPIASPTLTGTPAAPTATAGTNTTQLATTAFVLANNVPAGAVHFFAMSAAPTGYLKANGAAVSRTTYSTLFTAISTTFGSGDGSTTFNLPDLRGEFIRGWDDSRGVDTGRALGSTQADELKSHFHLCATSNGLGGPYEAAPGGTATGFDYGPPAPPTSSTGDTETRPRNVALLACIKF